MQDASHITPDSTAANPSSSAAPAEAPPSVAPVEPAAAAAAPQAPPIVAPAEPAQALPGTQEFAAKARDLEALRTAVVDAAGVGAGLWLSYLFVLFYLAIATGGVTHRDLLFENPVKLPFLNVDLPLRGFFVLGPAIFLIVHAYVLLHFVMLAGKSGVFHAALENQIADPEVRAALRRQLPSNIFVQVLAGPRELRAGFTGGLLRFITQVTLVGGPILLLVFFELQFLPFHHEPIAWWQRMAVLIDLILLWKLWPSIAHGEHMPIGLRDLRRPKVAAWALASLVPVVLVFTVATFPGELLDKNPLRAPVVPIVENFRVKGWATPHKFLIAGDIDFVARKPTSLWSNRLVLPGVVAVDPAKFDTEAKIAAVAGTLSLRDRDLEGAVLIGAGLRKVDFTGANLRGASLDSADLRQAMFGCAERGKKAEDQQCTVLQGASLFGAQLQGANLYRTQLQGARLEAAQLQGARLDFAQLQGAMLFGAKLQGASLDSTELQGADLDSVWLAGAWLNRARLQGVSLAGARLHGASLWDTELQGAKLQNTLFGRAQLQGARMVRVFVWRTDPREMDAAGALIYQPNSEPKYRNDACPEACDWSVDAFASLRRILETEVPEAARGKALERIELLDPARRREGEEASANAWAELAQHSPSQDDYEKHLAEIWVSAGCSPYGAPYVLRGLVHHNPLTILWSASVKAALAAAVLDEPNCPGVRGLSDEEKAELRAMRERTEKAPQSSESTRP